MHISVTGCNLFTRTEVSGKNDERKKKTKFLSTFSFCIVYLRNKQLIWFSCCWPWHMLYVTWCCNDRRRLGDEQLSSTNTFSHVAGWNMWKPPELVVLRILQWFMFYTKHNWRNAQQKTRKGPTGKSCSDSFLLEIKELKNGELEKNFMTNISPKVKKAQLTEKKG